MIERFPNILISCSFGGVVDVRSLNLSFETWVQAAARFQRSFILKSLAGSASLFQPTVNIRRSKACRTVVDTWTGPPGVPRTGPLLLGLSPPARTRRGTGGPASTSGCVWFSPPGGPERGPGCRHPNSSGRFWTDPSLATRSKRLRGKRGRSCVFTGSWSHKQNLFIIIIIIDKQSTDIVTTAPR